MPIISAEIEYRLSGGAANSTPASSLGGAKSSVAVTGATLWDQQSSAEAAAGDTEYRCVYVHNADPALALQNAVVWIDSDASGRHAIGLGSSAVNGTEQTVANESTAPASVTFTQPASKGAGLSIGNIPAGQHKAIWLRRVTPPGAAAAAISWSIRVEGDTDA